MTLSIKIGDTVRVKKAFGYLLGEVSLDTDKTANKYHGETGLVRNISYFYIDKSAAYYAIKEDANTAIFHVEVSAGLIRLHHTQIEKVT